MFNGKEAVGEEGECWFLYLANKQINTRNLLAFHPGTFYHVELVVLDEEWKIWRVFVYVKILSDSMLTEPLISTLEVPLAV